MSCLAAHSKFSQGQGCLQSGYLQDQREQANSAPPGVQVGLASSFSVVSFACAVTAASSFPACMHARQRSLRGVRRHSSVGYCERFEGRAAGGETGRGDGG